MLCTSSLSGSESTCTDTLTCKPLRRVLVMLTIPSRSVLLNDSYASLRPCSREGCLAPNYPLAATVVRERSSSACWADKTYQALSGVP